MVTKFKLNLTEIQANNMGATKYLTLTRRGKKRNKKRMHTTYVHTQKEGKVDSSCILGVQQEVLSEKTILKYIADKISQNNRIMRHQLLKPKTQLLVTHHI